jgi:predicted alpha/beta hydrolase family esterase
MKPNVDWKYHLDEKLGSEFDVYNPSMPGKDFAEYDLWKMWYERVLGELDEVPIVVGHSLGAMFLTKYYSENIPKSPLTALLLVAPVYCGEEKKENYCHSFSFTSDISNIHKSFENVDFFFSEDDFVVSFDNYGFYKKALPKATYSVFKDRGHFLQEEFPELVEEIQKLP